MANFLNQLNLICQIQYYNKRKCIIFNNRQMQASKSNQPTKQKAIRIQDKGNKTVYVFDKRVSFEVDPKYKINQVIGRGVYGVVAEGQNVQTGQKVAVKLIKQLFRDPGQAKRQLRQIKILKFLKHNNIVALLDIMKIEDRQNFNQVYLVLQFMQYNLKKLIQSKNKINDNMIKFILYQILDGLHHMHSADIIHRDLKPENILINNKLELKIADMNLARKEDQNPTKYVVTRPYRALQVLLCSKNYTKSIDIWSVGCIFAELIGRTVLFEGSDCIDQLKRFVAILGKPKLELYADVDPVVKESFIQILKQMPDRSKIDWKTLFPTANPEALDLLDHMLQYDSKTRYNAQECLNHPFLKQIRQKSAVVRCQNVLDFSFDDLPMEIQAVRNAIYQQALAFHPVQQQIQSVKRPRTEGPEQNNQPSPQQMTKQVSQNMTSASNPGQPRKIAKTQ